MLEPKAPRLMDTLMDAIRHSLSGARALRAGLCLALIVVAGIIAPGESPDTWPWTRLLLAALSAGAGLALIGALRQPTLGGSGRRANLIIAAILLLIAIVLSATFTTLTSLFAIVILLLVVLHLNARGPSSQVVFWALIATLVPFWVWSAFEAWDRWLLMLIPVGIVGTISLEHALRSNLFQDDETERYAAWIGVLAMVALLLTTSIAIDAETRWVVLSAAIATILTAIDLMPKRAAFSDTIPGLTLPGISLLGLAFAWLLAL